jgi:hypothetical protein
MVFAILPQRAQNVTKEHKRYTIFGDPMCFSVNPCAFLVKKLFNYQSTQHSNEL